MTSLLLPFFLSVYTLDYSRCKYALSCEVKEGVLHMRLFPGDERAEARRIVDYAGGVGYENTANYFKIGPYDYTLTQRSLLQIYYSRFELRRLSASP